MKNLQQLTEQAEAIRLKYEDVDAKNGRAPWGIRDYAMGFVGDVGKLQKLIMAKENLRELTGIDDIDAALSHELADCLWSTLVLAAHYKLDLEKEFAKTMDVISGRIAKEYS